jgi:hypothetical protein
MTIPKVGQPQLAYQIEQFRLQDKRNDDYAKVVEKRRFEQIAADRVARNRRLELDKGQNIDLEA